MSRRVDGLSCENVLVRLEPLIDGELSVDEAAAISAHIEICSTCSEESILAKRIRAELRGLPELDTPDRVLRAVRWETGDRPSLDRAGRISRLIPQLPIRTLAAVAAVLLIALIGHLRQDRAVPEISDKEVLRATIETKLALSYLGEVTRRAERQVRQQVFIEKVVSTAAHGISRSLEWTLDAGGRELPDPVSTPKNGEGSS